MTLQTELILWAISGPLFAWGLHKSRTIHFWGLLTAWYAFTIWRGFLPWWVSIHPQETVMEYVIAAGSLTVIEVLIILLTGMLQGSEFSFPGKKQIDQDNQIRELNAQQIADSLNRGLEKAEQHRQHEIKNDNTAGNLSFRVHVDAGNPKQANLSMTLPNGKRIDEMV